MIANQQHSSAGASSYRLWIYTSPRDAGGSKAQLTIRLAGTLDEVTFPNLERTVARQGELFAPGHCCEIFQHAADVGSMLKMTVHYAAEPGSSSASPPWNLAQIIVRESASGSVSVFPANRTLSGQELLVLTPRLTWFGARAHVVWPRALNRVLAHDPPASVLPRLRRGPVWQLLRADA